MDTFDELIIAIDFPQSDGVFPVRLQTTDGKQYRSMLTLPSNESAYQMLVPPLPVTLTEADVSAFGALLAERLFVDGAGSAFEAARHLAGQRGKRLRLRLVIDTDAVLTPVAAVPWEFMVNDSGIPLVTTHSLCRSIPRPDPIPPLAVPLGEPVRLLIAWATPAGRVGGALETVEADVAVLKASLQPVVAAGLLAIEEVGHCSGPGLAQAVETYQPHLLHLMGATVRAAEQTMMLLEDAQGSQKAYSGRQLGILLEGCGIRLVVCHAPHSGLIGSALLREIAPALLSANIPAVVALQADMLPQTGQVFSTTFYPHLVQTGSLDLALQRSRKAIVAHGLNQTDWGSLVLYMRAADGMLFVSRPGPSPTMPTADNPPHGASSQSVLGLFASMPLDHLPEPTMILSPAARMTFSRNPQFVGRERELRNLALAIADPAPTVMVSAVAAGMGGLGKTSLAVEFVYRYARYFAGGVCWLNCADPATIPSEVAACAPALGLAVAGLDQDEQVAAVRRAWEDAIPRLLIFDNCEDPALLEQWRPPHGGSRVLVTARRGNWPREVYRVALGVLARADSIVLLTQLCPRLTPSEADGLAEDLGDLPLALHLAGNYLNTYDHTAADAYRAQLSLEHASLKGRGTESLPTKHERDVARTFALSYDQLDPANPIDALARWLLACAAQLAPGVPIPRDLLLAMAPAGTTPEDAMDALGRLRALGLLDGDVPVLHRLLSGFVQRQADLPAVRNAVEATMNDSSYAINVAGRPAAMGPILPHLRVVSQAAEARAGDQTATLLTNLGYYLNSIGDYAGARLLYERALEIWTTALGPNHPVTMRSLNNLATLLQDIGEWEAARPLLEWALRVREAVLGPDHPDTAISLNNLAALLSAIEDYEGAKPLYERALAINEAALGLNHSMTAASLNNLAAVLDAKEDHGAARPLYERALRINEAVQGPDHIDTARSLNNLAMLLHDIGESRQARPMLERALTITEAEVGPDHPDTATSLNNLATVLQSTGEYEDARSLFERALVLTEAALGSAHPTAQILRDNLAVCIAARDQTAPEA